jgi:predicted dehydrogenase
MLESMKVQDAGSAPLRIGLVGASFIAKVAVLIPSRLSGSNVTVIAVAARDGVRAKSYANRYGIAKSFEGYSNLFNDESVDAVYIAIPTALHIDVAKQAIAKGKHVLLEKPGGLSAKSLGELGDLAQAQGVNVAVAYHWRFHHTAIRLKELIATQRVGTVKSISTRFSMYDPKGQTSLAKLADRACYCLDLIRYLLPNDSSIQVVKSSVAGTTISAKLLAKTSDSTPVSATVLSQKDSIGLPEIDAVVEGSLGSITLRNFIFPMLYHSLEISVHGRPASIEKLYGNGETTFELQLAAFEETSRRGGIEHKSAQSQSVKDAQATLALVERLFAAAGHGDEIERLSQLPLSPL